MNRLEQFFAEEARTFLQEVTINHQDEMTDERNKELQEDDEAETVKGRVWQLLPGKMS